MSDKPATDDFGAHVVERLREYYGTSDRPVTFVRAETDLLMRVLLQHASCLVVEIRRMEKGPRSPHLLDQVCENMARTDLGLIESVVGKLRKSEQR